VQHITDSKIDFSDIPELSDTQIKHVRKVGRPKSTNPKQLIAIRVSPCLLQKLKKLALRKKMPYQRIMHNMLEKAVKEAA
jgi:predicted DNA binding CopG/RHH family protein